MTTTLRIRAGGVLVMAVAGLLAGAAGSMGLIPAPPDGFFAPAVAGLATAFAAIKIAAAAGAVLGYIVGSVHDAVPIRT